MVDFSLINKTCLKNIYKKHGSSKLTKRMLSIRTQLIVPYSCKFAIVPLFLSRYIYQLWPSRCTIMQKGSKKWEKDEKKYEDLGLYCKKMTCFLNDYAVQWWRCWLCAERWGLVVYCNIGFGCSEKKINVCNVKQRRIFLRDLTFIRRLYL